MQPEYVSSGADWWESLITLSPTSTSHAAGRVEDIIALAVGMCRGLSGNNEHVANQGLHAR